MLLKITSLFVLISFFIYSCSESEQTENKSNTSQESTQKIRIYVSSPGENSLPHSRWYIDEDKPTGVEPLLIETILNKLHLEYEYVSDYSVIEGTDPRIEILKSGYADVSIRGITITDERKKLVLFSSPYFIDGLGIIVKKDSEIKDTSDLHGKSIFVSQSSTAEIWAKKHLLQSEIITWYDASEKLSFPEEMVLKNSADAFVLDQSFLNLAIKNYPQLRLLEQTYSRESLGIAIRKERKDLKKKIDEVLKEMKESGELEEIMSEMGRI